MPSDPNSSANFNSFLTTHLHLNLAIDFSAKILKGFVEILLKRLENVETIVLDVANVAVKSATHQDHKIPVKKKTILLIFILFSSLTIPKRLYSVIIWF